MTEDSEEDLIPRRVSGRGTYQTANGGSQLYPNQTNVPPTQLSQPSLSQMEDDDEEMLSALLDAPSHEVDYSQSQNNPRKRPHEDGDDEYVLPSSPEHESGLFGGDY